MLLTISENDDIINYKSEIYSINEKHLIISESMIESLEFRNPLINFRGLEKINSHFLAKMTYIESPEFPIEKIIKIRRWRYQRYKLQLFIFFTNKFLIKKLFVKILSLILIR